METPKPKKREWTDQQAEEAIGVLLQIGVGLAAVIVFLGGILYLIHYGAMPTNYRVFRGEPQDLRSLSGVVKDAFSFRRRGLIQLGLLVLIATPIARVLFSIYSFLRERDVLYVVVTLIVFAILLFSLIFGHA